MKVTVEPATTTFVAVPSTVADTGLGCTVTVATAGFVPTALVAMNDSLVPPLIPLVGFDPGQKHMLGAVALAGVATATTNPDIAIAVAATRERTGLPRRREISDMWRF